MTTTGTAGSVRQRLGVRITGPAEPLLGLAVRQNPRRAQLLVSRLLGKHVPTDPRLVRAAGLLLGALVADVLADRPPREVPHELLAAAAGGDRAATVALAERAVAACRGERQDALVLGFAETATGLGHCVAEALGGADYLHSTRRPVADHPAVGAFTEDHSHARDHLLLPADPALLRGDRPLVLVDDELSTGRTALNTIGALHRVAPRQRYLMAALVDVRPADGDLVAGVRALGARLDVLALAGGAVQLPADLAARAAALRAELARPDPAPGPAPAAVAVSRVALADLGWPRGLAAGGRHGFLADDHVRLAAVLPGLAAGLGVRGRERTLVLGTEELMALPLRLAQTLADAGHDVQFSTTSRSPALVVDEPDYALRSGITFPAHDDPVDGPGPRFAYNLGGPGDPRWDHLLVVVDPPADTPALRSGLLAAAAGRAHRSTLVVTP